VDTPATVATTGLNLYFPQAKLGKGNYIYVWSGSWGQGNSNFFGISGVSGIASSEITSTPAMPVSTAYAIDKKIDDGYPYLGRVLAIYVSGGGVVSPWATSDSATTCFNDTSPLSTSPSTPTPGNYSITVNNGAGVNCAISIMFQ
jgi:hypothetical protein